MTASRNRLGTGSAIYLYNDALGKMSEGFEQTILLGTIQQVEWREPGYQIYQLKVHLYSHTAEPLQTKPMLQFLTPIFLSAPYSPTTVMSLWVKNGMKKVSSTLLVEAGTGNLVQES